MARKPSTQAKQVFTLVNDVGDLHDRPDVQLHWTPVYCAQHHLENVEKRSRCGEILEYNHLTGGYRVRGSCKPINSYLAYFTMAREVLLGGPRYGLKTETMVALVARGNPGFPAHPIENGKMQHRWVKLDASNAYCPYCVNATYLAHPRYTFLILRKNYDDLKDLVGRLRRMYPHANVTEDGMEFPRPNEHSATGPRGVFGHMQDERVVDKYQGQEYTRIFRDEITQIASPSLYKDISLSCRSAYEGGPKTVHGQCGKGHPYKECDCGILFAQEFNSTNPLGPGHRFVRERFVDVGKPNRIAYLPTGRTVMFLECGWKDNPFMTEEYKRQLDDLEEPKRSAWRDGKWDIAAGQYFSKFRPEGPFAGEPEAARHVIKPVELPAWSPRTIGVDWGFKHRSAAYWFGPDLERRVHTYREFSGSELSPEELGALIARESLPELLHMPDDLYVTIYLSHDCFNRTDVRTRAEQFSNGILSVTGPKSVFLVQFDQHEETIALTDPDRAQFLMEGRLRQHGRALFVIRPSTKSKGSRVDGWNHMRSMMRFVPLNTFKDLTEIERATLMSLPDGHELYGKHLKAKYAHEHEVLPKWLIHDTCPKLIQALSDAVHDEDGEDLLEDGLHTNDELNACRYGLVGVREVLGKLPFEQHLALHMKQYWDPRMTFTDRIQMTERAQSDWDRKYDQKLTSLPHWRDQWAVQ